MLIGKVTVAQNQTVLERESEGYYDLIKQDIIGLLEAMKEKNYHTIQYRIEEHGIRKKHHIKKLEKNVDWASALLNKFGMPEPDDLVVLRDDEVAVWLGLRINSNNYNYQEGNLVFYYFTNNAILDNKRCQHYIFKEIEYQKGESYLRGPKAVDEP